MKPGLSQIPPTVLERTLQIGCGHWRLNSTSVLVTYVAPHISTPQSFRRRVAVRTCARHGQHSIVYTRASAVVSVVADRWHRNDPRLEMNKPPRPGEPSSVLSRF